MRGKVLGLRCAQETLGGGGFPASEDADLEDNGRLVENRIGRQRLRVAASTLWASVEQDETLGHLIF